jgi:hypothetical protein
MKLLSRIMLTGATTLLLSLSSSALAHDRQHNHAVPDNSPPRDIRVGDPLRKPLLDALRPAIEADLRQPVRFMVNTLRKQNGWAFAVVTPQTLNGRKIDFAKTRYAEAIREGVFDGDTIYALLEMQGSAWAVRSFVIGPTDVTYAGWPEEFGAPYPLFGLDVPK